MAEIRVDARLTRPGALVAGVADGRVVLVRVLRDADAGAPWVAAHAAGLPVPAVEPARCTGRPALLVTPTAGAPLGPATPAAVRSQAAALARTLAAHGIGAGRLRAGELVVRDGVLAVRVPVEGAVGDADAEAAALAATVDAACAGAAAAPERRTRRGPLTVAIALAAVAVVLGLTRWPGPPAPAPHTSAAQAAPLLAPPPPPAEPPAAAEAPRTVPPPAPARVHRPRHRRRAVPRHRPQRHRTRPAPSRHVRSAPPVRRRHRSGGGISPAGGHADPVPVL